jgi:phenylacetate-CoA ligase
MDRTARLREILARAKTLPFYAERLREVAPEDVREDDLSALPLTTRDEFTAHFRAHGPHGGFLRDDVVQLHLTPAPEIGRMPEYVTQRDLEVQAAAVAEHFARCGVGRGDRCLVVFSYHLLAGGWLFHGGLQRLGAAVLALGPERAETVVEIAQTYGFNVLVANPSFARRLGEAGARFELLLAAGEPFSAVPGYREAVEAALGCTALDAYGLSETGLVAAETREQNGLYVLEDACILEVLDPATQTPTPEGEKGEVVLTSLAREGMPVLRFRTGDLTLKGSRGGRTVLPRGVFGRTDQMVKIKGVKVYPRELLFVLAGTPGINFRNYQLLVRRGDGGSDAVTLRLEGDPATDTRELGERIRRALGIGMNEIRLEPSVTGELVVDERF